MVQHKTSETINNRYFEGKALYITTQKQLCEFVEHARTCDLLAVDTEFLREKTFWPKLCLMQLATEEQSVVVDPFRVGDLSPLAELFTDESILKLFHAAGQDMEIIHHVLGVVPKPIFDTQVAASLLGGTLQIGYGALVGNELGVKLKKADSFTDWSRRPLTDSQVEYALDDVIYLPPLYRKMRSRLNKLGRLEWLEKDFEEISDISRYEVDPYTRYTRLKRVNQLSSRQLSVARLIAAWRESVAMRRNIPRKWVMTDEQIVEICKREPRTLDDLFMVRGVAKALKMDEARRILDMCIKGLDAPEEEWPHLPKPPKSEPNVDPQVALLYSLVKVRAKENDVAFAVLASHADLAKIARGHYEDVDLLRGWRKHLVGDEVIDLVEGRIALTIQNGQLKVTKTLQ